VTLADVLRLLSSGGGTGGPCRDTDPILRLAETLPCGPVGVPPGASAAYVQRTMGRRAALQQLDELCFWHLLLIEVPADYRDITAARRELHIRLRQSQREDDEAEFKQAANGG